MVGTTVFKATESTFKEEKNRVLYRNLYISCVHLPNLINTKDHVFFRHTCRNLYRNIKSIREVKYRV